MLCVSRGCVLKTKSNFTLLLYIYLFQVLVSDILKSKKVGKDQESIQLSTIPDP